MMRGIIIKGLRETWLATFLFSLALLVVKYALTFILPQVLSGIDEVFAQMPFVRQMVSALLGTEIGDRIAAESMQAFLWVHPMVLTLVWAQVIVFCTRLPAGEIDRGTIDVLLSLPISRRRVYWSETLVWAGSGVILILAGFVGHLLAAPGMPAEMRPSLIDATRVMFNLFAVYLAVGGLTCLISACSDRRGRAVGIAFALVLTSFMINFLAQYWDPMKDFAFLSVMNYYQPAVIVRDSLWPVTNVAILAMLGSVAWIAGGEIFARRSICTV
jgi:ABC-type transport system involved in multi-copper enzyme maturation permease subunit